MLFLVGLSKEFDNAHQILKLQVKSFTQIIESLVTAETSIKGLDIISLENIESTNWSWDLE